MEAIITAMSDVTDLMSSAFTLMTANPLLTFYLSASLVPIGFGIFRLAKGAAKK